MAHIIDNIVDKLEVLDEIEGVELNISQEKKTIYLKYNTVRSLDFKFVWSEDHFIGYFIDREGIQSQAVVSLWSALEAVNFVTSYSLLLELRAGR
ncbi:hypothetical protein [Geoalkalibacter halelectricus]|uniref:Uncharacterized protein n=1 Tax=Geoalkalibacter halelectricus TaxID=2847045 RepID=A0ABY5ZLK8_9BACT|nr:hypothetical protein [Geoalkalibacter halelectricus]MDO3377110.1 hypothetical protein [Geoalkalibacter halelectricus]UWZ79734.1 hypothetical protein L9S41_18945 [Geoalkalibacter halelectricus]